MTCGHGCTFVLAKAEKDGAYPRDVHGLIDAQRADGPLVRRCLPVDRHPSQVQGVAVLGVVLRPHEEDCQYRRPREGHESYEGREVGGDMDGARGVRARLIRGHPVILEEEVTGEVCRDEVWEECLRIHKRETEANQTLQRNGAGTSGVLYLVAGCAVADLRVRRLGSAPKHSESEPDAMHNTLSGGVFYDISTEVFRRSFAQPHFFVLLQFFDYFLSVHGIVFLGLWLGFRTNPTQHNADDGAGF